MPFPRRYDDAACSAQPRGSRAAISTPDDARTPSPMLRARRKRRDAPESAEPFDANPASPPTRGGGPRRCRYHRAQVGPMVAVRRAGAARPSPRPGLPPRLGAPRACAWPLDEPRRLGILCHCGRGRPGCTARARVAVAMVLNFRNVNVIGVPHARDACSTFATGYVDRGAHALVDFHAHGRIMRHTRGLAPAGRAGRRPRGRHRHRRRALHHVLAQARGSCGGERRETSSGLLAPTHLGVGQTRLRSSVES